MLVQSRPHVVTVEALRTLRGQSHNNVSTQNTTECELKMAKMANYISTTINKNVGLPADTPKHPHSESSRGWAELKCRVRGGPSVCRTQLLRISAVGRRRARRLTNHTHTLGIGTGVTWLWLFFSTTCKFIRINCREVVKWFLQQVLNILVSGDFSWTQEVRILIDKLPQSTLSRPNPDKSCWWQNLPFLLHAFIRRLCCRKEGPCL